MKKYIVIIIVSGVFSFSCKESSDIPLVPSNKLITSIRSTKATDNVLHVIIDIVYKQNAKAEIEYWKTSDPKNKKRIVDKQFSPATKQTLHILFLEAETEYEFRLKAYSVNSFTESKVYKFTTSKLPPSIPQYTIRKNELNKQIDGYIVLTQQSKPGVLSIINQEGKVVWYYIANNTLRGANYDPITKTFLCLSGFRKDDALKMKTFDNLFIVDLFGNKQLKMETTEFASSLVHHDAIRTKNGEIAVINFVPKEFDLSNLGGEKKQVVYGDGITIYNLKGKKVWQWDCFSERNPVDDPEILTVFPGSANGTKRVDDWLHANAICEDKEGNFLISFNFISEIWKINRKTKKVLWRLGEKGILHTNNLTQFMQGNHSVCIDNNNLIYFLDNGMKTQQSRHLSFAINDKSQTAIKIDEISFPKEYFTKYMGNSTMIDNELTIFGSSVSQNILITDKSGNPLWICQTPHPFFRAQLIPFFQLQ